MPSGMTLSYRQCYERLRQVYSEKTMRLRMRPGGHKFAGRHWSRIVR